MKNIAFLTYLNRSGSTWLARLLDEYSEISVSPEARIPDGITYGPIKLKTVSDIGKFLDRLYCDYKFRAWNIDRAVLRERLGKLSFPVTADAVLKTILTEYFKNDDARVYVYKCAYIDRIDDAKKIFNDGKFIAVVRDVRGIFNSQKKAIDSTTRRPMSNNPVTTAVMYKLTLSSLDRVRGKGYVHVARYEDLVYNTADELKRICDFLGVGSDKRAEDKGYYKKIVPEQKHLHPNVEMSPLKERIWAWQDELTRLEIMTLQKVAKEELVRNGYDLIDLGNMLFAERMGYYLFWLGHLGRIFRKIAVGIKMWLRSPQLFKKDYVHLVAPNFSRTVHAFMSRLRSLGK